MKLTHMLLLTLALLAAPLAHGQSIRNTPDDPRVQLLAADNTLKNIATALEMYASDHDKQYPQQLAVLVEQHYLKTLDGARSNVVYLRDEAGTCFSLHSKPGRFRSLGIDSSWPRYDSEIGLQLHPRPGTFLEGLPVSPALTVSGQGWSHRGSDRSKTWTRDGEELQSRVLSPLGWSTPAERVGREVAREGAEVKQLQLPGQLQGTEVSWSRDGVRHDAVYVYTSGLLWELTYTAAADRYNPEHAAWLRQALAQVESWT